MREANISNKDIAALETHDCFSIAAIINLEDLGFADPGKGVEIYRSLYRGEDPSLSVNRSGGLKGCGHPVGATGIKQMIDVAKELQRRQERYGMAHNFGGSGATCGIHILEHTLSA
jgi:acetyl-CoA C-acetyltransferase